MLFVVVDVGADNDHVLQYFGLKAQEAPTLRFINVETTKKYAPEHGAAVTAATITSHPVLFLVRSGPTSTMCARQILRGRERGGEEEEEDSGSRSWGALLCHRCL